MKKMFAVVLMSLLALGLTAGSLDAEAKRLGGGSSFGRQSSSPTVTPRKAVGDEGQATRSAAPPTSNAAPAAAPTATPAQKPGFLSRFGPALAGLGIGALLGSLFSGGGGIGLLLMLVAGVVIFMLMRRSGAGPVPAAAGAGTGGAAPSWGSPTPTAAQAGPSARPDQGNATMRTAGMGFANEQPGAGAGSGPGFGSAPDAGAARAMPQPGAEDLAALMRTAQAAFIRLQAANDARDLDDLRSASTPEVFAELAMQIRERGDGAQRTEVVTLKSDLVELVTEGEYAIMSVRYSGTLRENAGQPPEAFDEVWHLRRDLRDPNGAWLIAGIQQVS